MFMLPSLSLACDFFFVCSLFIINTSDGIEYFSDWKSRIKGILCLELEKLCFLIFLPRLWQDWIDLSSFLSLSVTFRLEVRTVSGPWTSDISMSWELVKKANSLASWQTTDSETQVDPKHLSFNKPCR